MPLLIFTQPCLSPHLIYAPIIATTKYYRIDWCILIISYWLLNLYYIITAIVNAYVTDMQISNMYHRYLINEYYSDIEHTPRCEKIWNLVWWVHREWVNQQPVNRYNSTIHIVWVVRCILIYPNNVMHPSFPFFVLHSVNKYAIWTIKSSWCYDQPIHITRRINLPRRKKYKSILILYQWKQ